MQQVDMSNMQKRRENTYRSFNATIKNSLILRQRSWQVSSVTVKTFDVTMCCGRHRNHWIETPIFELIFNPYTFTSIV